VLNILAQTILKGRKHDGMRSTQRDTPQNCMLAAGFTSAPPPLTSTFCVALSYCVAPERTPIHKAQSEKRKLNERSKEIQSIPLSVSQNIDKFSPRVHSRLLDAS
jgi:hypothetical protein